MEDVILYILFAILGGYLTVLGRGNTNRPEEDKKPVIKKINPMEAYRQKEEKRIAEREQRIYQANLENINNYKWLSDGQKDIPKE